MPDQGNVYLGLNAAGFLSQLNQVVANTANFNTAVGNINFSLKQVTPAANAAAKGLNNLSSSLKTIERYATITGFANLAHSLIDSSQAAAEFSRSVALIRTITQDAGVSTQEWVEGLRAVSTELALPLAQTSAAAYDLLSNQVAKGADAFDLLRTAGNLANITNSSVEASVNSLSNAINAYGFSTRDAESLSAKFFTTVDLGRVRLNEFQATSGRVYETGKSLGVSFEEINAGLAAITQTGVKTDTSMTLLVNVFQKLLKPTKELQDLYDRLGVTPDSFVRINGLAGALKILREETGGSTAAVSKYFNEIRSSQGFQILIDQADQYDNALKEQTTSLERASKAKKEFESSEGFKFQQQVQELKNALTTGFETEVLRTILTVTGAFGGLKETVYGVSNSLIGFAGGLAVFKIATAEATISLVAMRAALSSLALPVGLAIAVGALTVKIAELYQQSKDLETHGKAVYKASLDSDRALIAEEGKRYKEGVDGFKKSIDERQKTLLNYTTQARAALNKIGSGIDENVKSTREGLRNSVELATGGARDALKQLENALASARSNVEGSRQAQKALPSRKQDLLFDFQRAKDFAETGGQNEQRILQTRIDQLDKERKAAANRGDREALNAAFAKAESIIAEASTATNPDGSLKFYNQLQAINQLLEGQIALERQIEASEERKAAKLRQQREELAKQVKAVEDAGKALLDFDVLDNQGQRRFSSTTEFAAERDRLKAQWERANAALQANPNGVSGRFLEQQKVVSDRLREVNKDWLAFQGAQSQRFGNLTDRGAIDSVEAAAQKITDAAIRRINQTADAAQEASLRTASVRAAAKEGLDDIRTNSATSRDSGIWERVFDRAGEANAAMTKFLSQIQAAAGQGDFKTAFKRLDEAQGLVQRAGTLDEPVLQYGRKDAEGNLISKTPRQAFSYARARLSDLQRATLEEQQSKAEFEQSRKDAPAALDGINETLKKWKEVGQSAQGAGNISTLVTEIGAGIEGVTAALAKAAENIRIARENATVTIDNTVNTTRSKSMGGFAGYFAAGGQPRGIDTVMARVDPREFIMNPQASMRFRPLLAALNAGFGASPREATTNVGDIHVNVNGGSTSAQTVNEIGAGLRRGIRLGTIRL